MKNRAALALSAACAPAQNLGTASEPYLIGVSGGRDSVALLHGLVRAGYSALIICHLNHQLRAESAEEALFVKRLAEQFGLQLVLGQEDVRARAKRAKQSIETAARAARFSFFARVARERDCRTVLLAHHADDQVETLLFNLFRGAGPGGLGMRMESIRTIDGTPLRILRPLLGVWRQEIDAYLHEHSLEWREDHSNLDLHFTRNRLRRQLIPQLEEAFGRDVRKTLWRTAEILRAEDEWIASQVAPPPEELSVPLLLDLPVALQRRTLCTWLKNHGVTEISFDTIERVRALLSSRPAKVNLPGALHVRRRAKRLFLERPEKRD